MWKSRLITVVLVLILLSVSSLAESPMDLASLDLNQLVALRNQIDLELQNRMGFGDSEIFSGQYVVGDIIDPGKYTITCTSGSYFSIDVYLPDEADGTYGDRLNSICLQVGETAFIRLDGGNILRISGGSGMVKSSDPTWSK